MKSIVLIFPYFGVAFPAQFNIWWKSALKNPTIDFMIFTDINIEGEKNIHVIKMSFESFREKVQSVFDFTISLNRPYKLCEYKQTYGYVLQEYIKEYDFWGFGDMDLVYGDIRAFITDEVLSHKFILGWGHLTLLCNDEDTNTFFMKQVKGYQNYKDAFTTSKITFFDEFNHQGCSDKWRDYRPEDCWLEEPFDNVSKPKQSYHFCSLNRGWKQVIFEHIDNKLFMIRYYNGTWEKKESLYAHFQHRGFMKDKITDYSHFLVTPSSMINYPKRFIHWTLRYYCRKRTLTTKFYQWRDYLIWRLRMDKQR